MNTLETERLILRPVTVADAEFIFRLLNDPSWIRYIVVMSLSIND